MSKDNKVTITGNVTGNTNFDSMNHVNQTYNESSYGRDEKIEPTRATGTVKKFKNSPPETLAENDVAEKNADQIKIQLDKFLEYRPQKKVKEGTEIYFGVYGEDDERVAVKIFDKKNINAKDILAEIEKLKGVKVHKNVLKFCHDFEDEFKNYIAFEFVSNNPWMLSELDETKTIDKKKVLRDITEALHFLHEHKIVHQRFDPSNIFVLKDSETKLINYASPSKITVAKLEDRFDAPEVYKGEKATTHSNIFSLLGIYHFVVSDGCLPFSYDKQRGKTSSTFPFNGAVKTISLSVDTDSGMLARMLAMDPKSRPTTEEIMRQATCNKQ